MYASRFFLFIYCAFFCFSLSSFSQDSEKIDREFTLEATMLGYFAADGAKNPTLRAKKGERIRLKIVNGELMTHDIALEKLALKSKTILEKGAIATLVFTAQENDIY